MFGGIVSVYGSMSVEKERALKRLDGNAAVSGKGRLKNISSIPFWG